MFDTISRRFNTPMVNRGHPRILPPVMAPACSLGNRIISHTGAGIKIALDRNLSTATITEVDELDASTSTGVKSAVDGSLMANAVNDITSVGDTKAGEEMSKSTVETGAPGGNISELSVEVQKSQETGAEAVLGVSGASQTVPGTEAPGKKSRNSDRDGSVDDEEVSESINSTDGTSSVDEKESHHEDKTEPSAAGSSVIILDSSCEDDGDGKLVFPDSLSGNDDGDKSAQKSDAMVGSKSGSSDSGPVTQPFDCNATESLGMPIVIDEPVKSVKRSLRVGLSRVDASTHTGSTKTESMTQTDVNQTGVEGFSSSLAQPDQAVVTASDTSEKPKKLADIAAILAKNDQEAAQPPKKISKSGPKSSKTAATRVCK